MAYPEKWRETADPFSLPLRKFKITEILGYPHAGNDVFHVGGIWERKPCRAYIKVERQKGADIQNEAETIARLPFDFAPKVLEYFPKEPRTLVTLEAKGERLSAVVGDNRDRTSLAYMKAYGRTLATLHGWRIACEKVKHRDYFDIPGEAYFKEQGLERVGEFLMRNPPEGETACFVHGDFHYANVLWDGPRIGCVLDFELSGEGIREFDIAWALVLRPGQRFLKTREERNLFLAGYSEAQTFSKRAFCYYYALIACRFFSMGDAEYKNELKRILNEIMLPD